MKKCLIYSITIYLLIIMFIILQKPTIIYDDNNNLKSLNYFKSKLRYGFQDSSELICLPTIAICSSVFSFIIAKQLIDLQIIAKQLIN